jgi:ketosteroid isomerase-like protein
MTGPDETGAQPPPHRARDAAEVLAAAEARAGALARRDAAALTALLHPSFSWISHTGDTFDRAAYVGNNTAGAATWHEQRLERVEVTVVGDTAVLRCTVQDDVETEAGRQLFRMPMTQVWVRDGTRWLCLAGHAGPRLTS